MMKTIAKIGSSQELILDPAVLEYAGIRIGDEVDVEVQPDGRITLSLIRPAFPEDDISSLIDGAIRNYASLQTYESADR
jgi:antitoxin component of MazEF toxin-antitoxin module